MKESYLEQLIVHPRNTLKTDVFYKEADITRERRQRHNHELKCSRRAVGRHCSLKFCSHQDRYSITILTLLKHQHFVGSAAGPKIIKRRKHNTFLKLLKR